MKAAREATTLDPMLGEAWAVLGYLLCAAGKPEEGQAAARRATALEPDNWRHHYRLAYGTWGEERLRAVDRTLSSMPGFAPARMLSCMVFVARGTMDRAEREASIGADAQRQHQDAHTPLPAVGFHWLRGMILATRGDRAGALECFAEEIDAGKSGHVYGREFVVNAHVAAGFLHLAGERHCCRVGVVLRSVGTSKGDRRPVRDRRHERGRRSGDRRSDREASGTRRRPSSRPARRSSGSDPKMRSARSIDCWHRRPPGPAGWIIPIDPMLASIREPLREIGRFSRSSPPARPKSSLSHPFAQDSIARSAIAPCDVVVDHGERMR